MLTTPANSTEDLPRAAGQIAASIAIAALSWKFVEEPVRHGAIGRAWRRIRTRRLASLGASRLAAAAGAVGVLVVACAGLGGVVAIPAASGAAALGAGTGALSASTNSISHAGGKHGEAAQEQRHPARSQPDCSRSGTAAHVLHIRHTYRGLDVGRPGLI